MFKLFVVCLTCFVSLTSHADYDPKPLNITTGVSLIPLGFGMTWLGEPLAGTFSLFMGVYFLVNADEYNWKLHQQMNLAEHDIKAYLLGGELPESVNALIQDFRLLAKTKNQPTVAQASTYEIALAAYQLLILIK